MPLLFLDLGGNEAPDDPPKDVNGTEGNDLLEGTTDPEEVNAGAGNDLVTAWDGDDTVNGGEGSDVILGEAGHDLIFGGAGDDGVDGGSGIDTIWLGDGNDVILDDGVVSDPLFDTGPAGDDKISGGDGNDVLLDWEGANTLTGELGRDFLLADDPRGSAAADSLSGGWGVDTLWGDDGDTISGGEYTDDFTAIVDETDDSAEAITDFDAASETLRLVLDADTLESATAGDLTMATDPQSGDVTLFFAGQKVAVLIDPGAFDLAANVVLPGWLTQAA